MNVTPAPLPESIHPSLWRASQLARGQQSTVDTGYPALSQELPGGGWPIGALVEVLSEQPGSGEIRLLAPALRVLNLPVALVERRDPTEPGAEDSRETHWRPVVVRGADIESEQLRRRAALASACAPGFTQTATPRRALEHVAVLCFSSDPGR
jgi:hypothetical protein